MNTHLYLRASTKDQDANRARADLEIFAQQKSLRVVDVYSENISGTKLNRPELMRLLEAAKPGEILLCESVDRLSRLSMEDWDSLKSTIKAKGLRLIVADMPTSWEMASDSIPGEIMRVINDMLIDLMSTMARLDQAKRVERINQGLANKRVQEPTWKPKGKSKNLKLRETVKALMAQHPTMNAEQLAKLADCGVATIYRIKQETL
ncbi:recombinase family protein [Pseudomonas guariconensis]|uniref:recombinase family protein n=1 Tax=Pseudomonas guariconensis TaxID=1288410 RepID=UPI003467D49B